MIHVHLSVPPDYKHQIFQRCFKTAQEALDFLEPLGLQAYPGADVIRDVLEGSKVMWVDVEIELTSVYPGQDGTFIAACLSIEGQEDIACMSIPEARCQDCQLTT